MDPLKTFECVIWAEAAAKGNSRRLGKTWSGKPISRKSEKGEHFMDNAIRTIRMKARGRKFHPQAALRVRVLLRYQNSSCDLDASLVYDAMQRARLIDDDVQIEEKHECRDRDKGQSFVRFVVDDIGLLPWRRTRNGKVVLWNGDTKEANSGQS